MRRALTIIGRGRRSFQKPRSTTPGQRALTAGLTRGDIAQQQFNAPHAVGAGLKPAHPSQQDAVAILIPLCAPHKAIVIAMKTDSTAPLAIGAGLKPAQPLQQDAVAILIPLCAPHKAIVIAMKTDSTAPLAIGAGLKPAPPLDRTPSPFSSPHVAFTRPQSFRTQR